MPSLKELRGRIAGVKSTRKITSAMKMVAASKLRRAQLQAEASRPYAETMRKMMMELASTLEGLEGIPLPALLKGTGKDQIHLLVVMTSDRGLAGGFNATMVRAVRKRADELISQGKTVKILPIGAKGADILGRYYPGSMLATMRSIMGAAPSYDYASTVAAKITALLEEGQFDCCTLFRNRFVNAMTQIPEQIGLIPLPVGDNDNREKAGDVAPYGFEPDEETLLTRLLPRNLEVQLYAAMLESAAGEQGARMTAMDNASRNAGKAIDRLSLKYNRTRQANITNELIEIISGAEAV